MLWVNKLLVLLLVACQGYNAAAAVEDVQSDMRVVAGFEVEEMSRASYQVSLRRKFGRKNHICGGCIASDRWILTAAHCTHGITPEGMKAVVGTLRLDSGGDEYDIEKIIVHEWYNPEIIGNDIALFKTAKEFQKGRGYAPIPFCAEATPADTMMLLVGWGKTSVSKRTLIWDQRWIKL